MTATRTPPETTQPAPNGRQPSGPRGNRRVSALSRAWGGFRNTLAEARNWRELRRTPYGLGPVAILVSVELFQQLETRAFSVAAPNIAQSLGISLRGIIGIEQMVGVFSVLAAIFLAWSFDRHRRAPWVGIGTTVSGIAGMWNSTSTSFGTLVAPRVVDDVGSNLFGIPISSLLADFYPPETRGRVFALLGLSQDFTAILAILIASPMVEWFGWRRTGFVLAIPVVIVGLFAMARLREPVRGYFERKALGASDEVALHEDEPLSIGESWRTVWSIRTLRRTIVGDIWLRGGSVMFFVLFPFYLAEDYGMGALARGMLQFPALILGIAGAYIGGGLVDSFSRKRPGNVLLLVGLFGTLRAACLPLIAIHPPVWVIAVFFGFFGFGSALTGPALNVIYTQVLPPNVRTMGGAISRISYLPGIVLFLSLAGSLQDSFGYTPALLAGVPFIVLGSLILATAAPFFDLDRRNAFASAVASEEARRAKAAGTSKLLVCRGIDVEYDGVQVLFDVDFDVEEGEVIALLGTNGAGKSTLLRALSGIQEASNGAVLYDGRDITHMPPHEIAARGVITMPGGRGVFPGLTVRDNLMLGSWMTDDPAETRRQLAEVYELFPILRERLDEAATLLSGGEQQMLSLAQAFLSHPRLLLIDELSLGLSPAVVAQLLDIVRELHKRGITIVVVEQSVNVALTIADKAIFMEKGEVRFVGKTADLLRRPDILRAIYVKGTGALTEGSAGSLARAESDRRALEIGGARAVLEVDGITKRFGGITALDEISFDLHEGEVLGIIGPNGSGKTTLFDVISGYQLADGGRIRFDGVDITDLSPEERARRKLVRRFQDARMFGSLTVFETLLVSLEQRLELKSAFLSAFAVPQARRAERRVRARADRLVELLELEAYRDKFVNELSTGLRRIVDLACVLAAEPKVLLLDEPSSGIAQAEAEALGPLLRRVRYETGCSMMLIEHDMPLISAVADELIAMDRGTVLIRGGPDAVLNDERVIEAYLGTSEEAVRRSGRLK